MSTIGYDSQNNGYVPDSYSGAPGSNTGLEIRPLPVAHLVVLSASMQMLFCGLFYDFSAGKCCEVLQ
jgi:hypothetical protein